MHPAISHVLQYFAYTHLQEPMFTVSKRFHDLAWDFVDNLPNNPNPEATVALRKLLESKDAAVRAVLPPSPDISR